MKQELLFNPDGPALSVLSATPSSVYDLSIGWNTAHPEWDIRRVAGERSRAVNEAQFYERGVSGAAVPVLLRP